MAIITGSYLDDEVAAATASLNHNIAELIKAEESVEQIKEMIAASRGAVNAFTYLIEGKLEEEEKPDDSDNGEEE